MKKKCARSEPFIETRNHHSVEIAEDYVEIVFDLINQKGEARTCDIADHLGVSHVTAVRTIDRLKQKGYLVTEQHQPVTLSKKGLQLAMSSKEKHHFLLQYLMALGISEKAAAIDVEGMEHHISQETLDAFRRHYQLLLEWTSKGS